MEVLNKEKVLEHAKRLIEEGKLDRAIVEYRRLIDIDPKDMRIKLRVAELLARQKRIPDAVNVYKEVADSYTDDGFYLKAVTVYKSILRLNPSLMDINYRLAELYEKMGLVKDAIHQYQILAGALEQKNDMVGLMDIRKKMVDLDPHNVANRIRLAETYQYQGMEDEAIDEYEKLVTEVKRLGRTDQLIELYEKILAYRPDNLEIVRALINIYYKRGEWKAIVSHLDKKGSLLEGQADLLMILADVYGRLNQVESAKNRYKEAAEIYLDRGEIEKALEAYRDILVVAPDDEEAVRELIAEIDEDYFDKVKAGAEKRRRKLEEAARLEEERAVSDEEAEPGKRKGPPKGEEAMPLYSEEEMEDRLRDADAVFELGKAYHQVGLSAEAEPELKKAFDIYLGLEKSGCREAIVTERIDLIKGWMGVRSDALSPKPEVKEQKTEVEEEIEVIEEVPKPDTQSQGAGDKGQEVEKDEKRVKRDKGAKGKRDKRMGFV